MNKTSKNSLDIAMSYNVHELQKSGRLT